MTARGLVVLTEQESLALARAASTGRVAHVEDGRVQLVPVGVQVAWRRVTLRTEAGSGLHRAAAAHLPALLEVDDLVEWSRSGWSVLLRGTLRPGQRTDGHGVEPWAGAGRDEVVVLDVDEVTGRRVVAGPVAVTVVPT